MREREDWNVYVKKKIFKKARLFFPLLFSHTFFSSLEKTKKLHGTLNPCYYLPREKEKHVYAPKNLKKRVERKKRACSPLFRRKNER